MRNVVVGRLRAGADEQLLDEALRTLLLLPMDGLLEMHVGRDARPQPSGNGGCHHHGSADSSIRSTHLTHQ